MAIPSAGAAECTGYNLHYMVASEPSMVGPAMKTVNTRWSSMVITDDPRAMQNLNLGEFTGIVTIGAGDSIGAVGGCTHADVAGDTITFQWV